MEATAKLMKKEAEQPRDGGDVREEVNIAGKNVDGHSRTSGGDHIINLSKLMDDDDNKDKIVPMAPISSGDQMMSHGGVTSVEQFLRIGVGADSSDEEAIELEFEREDKMVDTHAAHCPNCNAPITKVILRRRRTTPPQPQPQPQPQPPVPPPDDDQPPVPPPLDDDRTVCSNLWGCLSCCNILIPGHPDWTGCAAFTPVSIFDIFRQICGPARAPKDPLTPPVIPPPAPDRGSSMGMEIVKCIVYGGLSELITSMSVVSSATASGATTLNILGLGLATLFSAIFVFVHNLWDLKNDSSTRQNIDTQQIDRYEEHLGRRGNFCLHATVALVSFFMFGVVPPLVYSFAFFESDDSDYKILAVVAASLLCIIFLATGKAYVTRPARNFGGYVKVVMYYLVSAIAAFGVAYGAGDLITKLMARLGWFGGVGDGTTPPSALATPTHLWAYY